MYVNNKQQSTLQFCFLFYSPVKDRCVVSNYSLIGIRRNINIIGTFVLINRGKLPHATQHEKWVQQPLPRKICVYQKGYFAKLKQGPFKFTTDRRLQLTWQGWEECAHLREWRFRLESLYAGTLIKQMGKAIMGNYQMHTQPSQAFRKELARNWESAKFYWLV